MPEGDRRDALRAALPVAGLGVLALLVKLPTLGTPAFWDEMAYLDQARWLADHGLHRVLPGLRPDARFFGHPPGLHLAAAVLFKAFGASIPVAHALIAAFAAVGVCATYALAHSRHDPWTAGLAALLLLSSPAYFSSAGIFLADLPVAALGVLCAWLACRQRYLAYLASASAAVLVKETAASVVVAIALYRLVTTGAPTRSSVRDALAHAAPLAVLGLFVAWQKVVTGSFFYIFDFEFSGLVRTSPETVLEQAWQITRWLFVAQSRWVLSLAIAASLLFHPAASRRRELMLAGLVVMLSGYAFAVLFYAPRYVLPVLPFLCVVGAAALMDLARRGPWRLVAGGFALALTLWSLRHDPYRNHGEDNMHYRRMVRLYEAMASELVANHSEARILSAWPTAAQLSDPLLGYVPRPLRVTWYREPKDLEEADLVVLASPANPTAEELRALVARASWPLVVSHRHGAVEVALYRRP